MITTVTNSVEIHAAHALTVVGSASIGCPRQAHSLTAVVEAHHPETQEVLADCQPAPRDERNLEKEPHQEKAADDVAERWRYEAQHDHDHEDEEHEAVNQPGPDAVLVAHLAQPVHSVSKDRQQSVSKESLTAACSDTRAGAYSAAGVEYAASCA